MLTSEPLIGQGTALELSLTINELTEGDHMAWALAHPPAPTHTRLKIIRQQGSFVATNTGQWNPNFAWDPVSCVLVLNDNLNNAPIPISALSPFPRQLGTLFSLRYSGSAGDGKLHILENESRKPWEAQAALPDGRWSRVQYAAHDDLILLEASPNPAGGPLVCDIELVRVEPGDRLRGRFFAPETNPVPGPGNNL